MKSLFSLLLLLLSSLNAQAMVPTDLICRDQDGKTIVRLEYSEIKKQEIMIVNLETQALYSARETAPGVLQGFNGRRPEVPELDLTNGLQLATFKYDSLQKGDVGLKVTCAP